MGRFRQVLVFDRFLARIFAHFGERAVAKGGVVLDLRLERSRTTRDVDLRLTGSTDALLTSLQSAGRIDLGDYLTFLVEPDREHPTIEGEGMVYSGLRVYVRMVEQDDLQWRTLPDLVAAVRAFLDPVLVEPQGTWRPELWRW